MRWKVVMALMVFSVPAIWGMREAGGYTGPDGAGGIGTMSNGGSGEDPCSDYLSLEAWIDSTQNDGQPPIISKLPNLCIFCAVWSNHPMKWMQD